MKLKDLREKRAKLIADARALLDKADTEKRGLSPEEVESQNKLLADARALAQQIRNAEEIEAEERGTIPESQRTETRDSKAEAKEQNTAYGAALRSYIRNGFGLMTPDEQRNL